MNASSLVILCIFGIPIIAIICGTIIALCNKNHPETSNPKDIKLIQELHQNLERMEKRIESLETILFDDINKG